MNPFTFRTTTHPTTPADLGTPISSSAMEALIDEPGPVQLTTIGSSWSAPLKGLLNLKDPKAVQASGDGCRLSGQSLAPITLKSLLTKMWWGQLTPMLWTS